MTDPHAESTPPSNASLPTAAIVAGIGGLIAAIGVFLDWASISTAFEGGEFAGQQLPASSESLARAQGLDHWTGLLALVASIAAVAGAVAYVTLKDTSARRTAALAAAGGGAIALVMAAVAVLMSESIAIASLPGGREALESARQFTEQLGGLGFSVDTGPSFGLYVTALGGAAAAVGGYMALRQTESAPVAPGGRPTPPGTGFEARQAGGEGGSHG